MDQYKENPGSPELLWQYFKQREGICRGALLQLMMENHADFTRSQWAKIDRGLTNQERRFALHYLRQNKVPDFDSVVMGYLSPSQNAAVRKSAAGSLAVVDQEKNLVAIKAFVNRERDPKVLSETLFALDIKTHPALNEILVDLPMDRASSVHEAVMMIWSTAELSNKKELIGRYLNHSDPNLKAMARHLVDQMEKKGDLSWTMKNEPEVVNKTPAEEPVPEPDVDRSLQRDLLMAALKNDADQVLQLLQKGAQLNHPTFRGQSIFTQVLKGADVEMVALLLDQGAVPSLGLKGGNTALITAASSGYRQMPEKLRLLVSRGMDPNQANAQGETALMHAAMAKKLANLKTLIELGADPTQRDNLGRTALAIAKIMEHDQIANYLAGISK